jgi:hypothetical protein
MTITFVAQTAGIQTVSFGALLSAPDLPNPTAIAENGDLVVDSASLPINISPAPDNNSVTVSVDAMALRGLRDGGHAEDATQEAFTAIWRFAATHAPERGAAARWLFAVARNTVTDYHRQRPSDRQLRDIPGRRWHHGRAPQRSLRARPPQRLGDSTRARASAARAAAAGHLVRGRRLRPFGDSVNGPEKRLRGQGA